MTSKEALKCLEPLVERDTPMKPKAIYGEVFKKYNCSICNSTLDILGVKEVNFCPKCGQRIDWSK